MNLKNNKAIAAIHLCPFSLSLSRSPLLSLSRCLCLPVAVDHTAVLEEADDGSGRRLTGGETPKSFTGCTVCVCVCVLALGASTQKAKRERNPGEEESAKHQKTCFGLHNIALLAPFCTCACVCVACYDCVRVEKTVVVVEEHWATAP